MNKTEFSKKALTPEELLGKLRSQGLTVNHNDEIHALAYLRYVGGYRLKGYWYHLIDPIKKTFPDNYTFKKISDRYEFDHELRAATIAAIDHLEVAVRSVMANYLSVKYSPHWFLDKNIFQITKSWDIEKNLISKIREEIARARHHGRKFVKHYFDRYDIPPLPPSWAISECVSFGLWSKTYANLQSNTDKKAISTRFAITQTDVFRSWIHALTVIRNVVAHHGQLLRVRHGVSPANYKNEGIKFTDPKSFFAIATVVHYLLANTRLPNQWKLAIKAIFKKYPEIDIQELGFPADWEKFPGWE